MRYISFIIFSLSTTCALFATSTPPTLTPYETYIKSEEIFKAHVSYKEMNPEIVRRTLANFLEELDPVKSYFIESEVVKYTNPTDAFVQDIIKEYKAHKFIAFEEIYATMVENIYRRNSLENKAATLPLPSGVQAKEIRDASWPKNEEELTNKLLQIRALQDEAANRLGSAEQQELFWQRVTKRRTCREQELLGSSKLEQKRQVLSYFLKSMAASLDAHTMYFTPKEARQFLIQVQQRLFGIGAQLRDDLNGFTVVQIIDGSPASRNQELKVGDRIIAIDREPVAGMDITEAVELIRGPQGTQVILTILRTGGNEDIQRFDIAIVRDEIVLKESRYEAKALPFGDGVMAYLMLHAFYQDPNSSSSNDLRTALSDIQKTHQVRGVILDLRNNSGGLLTQAVEVSGLFIKNGVVTSVKDHTGQTLRLRNVQGDPAWSGPLIVLVNGASASASEIVAGTLKDYGRALVIGDTHTYGKGSFQTLTIDGSDSEKIHPQGEYKVTRGRYYTVGGGSPQLTGVFSEIEVPGIMQFIEIGEKYNKYPLANDHIDPLFQDDLADVHPLYRMRLRRMLGKDLQERLYINSTNLAYLSDHSQKRIQKSLNYQNFLASVKNIDRYDVDLERIGPGDLQLEEAYNIMREYIVLSSKSPKAAKSAKLK